MRNLLNCKKQGSTRRLLRLRSLSFSHLAVLTVLLSVLVTACSPSPMEPTGTAVPELPLTPYQLSTPTGTLPPPTAGIASNPDEPSPTIRPLPSSTPLIYAVKQGDTLLGIALSHGVSLEQIQEANPELDPNFLSVGTTLKIPAGQQGAQGGTATAIPSPTPVALSLAVPRCYPAGDGGYWCFAALHNDQNEFIESVSGWINVSGEDGREPVVGKEASLPLNVLPPGATLPLVAYFSAQEVESIQNLTGESARLLTALPISPGDRRYLPVRAVEIQVEIAGQSALIEGQVAYPLPTATPTQAPPTATPTLTPTPAGTVTPAPPQPPSVSPTATLTETATAGDQQAELIWLAAVAYGAGGEIVGVRKWNIIASLSSGESLPFEGVVYSVGPPIERVEVLVEAN